jgi:CRP/FNR family transcriptional regulator
MFCSGRSEESAKSDSKTLVKAVFDAGGKLHSAEAGKTAFRWTGRPCAFVLLRSGKVSVRFRTTRPALPWAECRAIRGQDCMPVTAAILSDADITVRATCLERTSWIELAPSSLVLLVHGNPDFRRALFAQHALRLPAFFARISEDGAGPNDQRLATWLMTHAVDGILKATHGQIAADLITAREVVSRQLKSFADKGWIEQGRGSIVVAAPSAIWRVARGSSAWCELDKKTRIPRRPSADQPVKAKECATK